MTLAVRPYGPEIRETMFRAFAEAGFPVVKTVEAGSTDAEAIAAILAHPKSAPLLIPFHAHRDSEGELVNGLELLVALQKARPTYTERPIVMPISDMGRAAFALIASRGEMPRALAQRMLMVKQEDLGATLVGRLRHHLTGWG